jgi:DNA-binding CsgD family transcriptional regulator
MVQTSQIGSFHPTRRSPEADRLLIRLHEADSVDKFAKTLFALVGFLMPSQCCILFLRPLEFELPCRFTPAKYKSVVEAYMEQDHKDDIWLKRSPVHPGVTVVRHGDYTSPKILRGSAFYQKVLRPLDSEFGISVVAWRRNTWLATLTVLHNEEQGEFSDEQLEELLAIHPHFECIIRRLAGYQESRLVHNSLRRFMVGLPTATMILDWNLRPLHFSGVAAQLCFQWKQGAWASPIKAPKGIQVPGDILTAIEGMKPTLSKKKPARKSSRSPIRAIHPHPHMSWFSATIEFLPSRTLTLTKGTFLVTLNETIPLKTVATVSEKLEQLTIRERECAWLASEGLQNAEIAKQLGKSQITVRNQLTSIYKKLGLRSRYKLIAEFSRLDLLTKRKLRSKG